MTLSIPQDIAQAAQDMASHTGTTAEHLLLQALQAHFPPLTPELQSEFDAWEQASDDDMARLNAREGLD